MRKFSKLLLLLFSSILLLGCEKLEEASTADTTSPTITLAGNGTVLIMQNSTYTDAGVAATDDVDGDISSNIVVSGDSVDTATLGDYVIRYNVSDAAGNAATEAMRTVKVVSHLKVFLTSTTVGGNIGGIAAADTLCQNDVNNPSDTYTYRALLVDGVDRSALNPTVDWVLQPNFLYKTIGNATFGTTNASSVFTSITNISANAGEIWWTGIADDSWNPGNTTSPNDGNCSRWTSNSGTVNGWMGKGSGDSLDATFNDGRYVCSGSYKLICVQGL